jgi:hypothetical protein
MAEAIHLERQEKEYRLKGRDKQVKPGLTVVRATCTQALFLPLSGYPSPAMRGSPVKKKQFQLCGTEEKKCSPQKFHEMGLPGR